MDIKDKIEKVAKEYGFAFVKKYEKQIKGFDVYIPFGIIYTGLPFVFTVDKSGIIEENWDIWKDIPEDYEPNFTKEEFLKLGGQIVERSKTVGDEETIKNSVWDKLKNIIKK